MPSEPGSLADWRAFFKPEEGLSPALTKGEEDCVDNGEPYCFKCGKPSSSFGEYASAVEEDGPFEGGEFGGDAHDSIAAYVRREEGTYNPETNRFACDQCYIDIGMPVGEPGNAYGWKAP